MTTAGLRELRQDASELIRRVEAGEVVDITVAGRLAAQLVPVPPRQWRRWAEVRDCFEGRPDPDFESDRELIDQSLHDPWESVG